jgi:hypothetical protein
MTKRATTSQEQEYRVGDRVRMDWGGHEIEGTVVEDRGNLGVGGRRILRVHFRFDDYDEDTFEVPAEDLRPAA